MAICRQLKELLEEAHVPYKVEEHPTAFTAQSVAEVSHVSGKEMIKTVIITADGRHLMAALPASRQIDLQALETLLDADDVHLAEEREFALEFPDCEIGAMPPIGSIYNMKLVAAEPLRNDSEIAFNAGNHREIVKMQLKDWENLTHPQWGRFTKP